MRGLTVTEPPSASMLFVAVVLSTVKLEVPAEGSTCTLVDSSEASISIPACVKSAPSNCARADRPHSPILPDALPQMFFGREAKSVVGRRPVGGRHDQGRLLREPLLRHGRRGQ